MSITRSQIATQLLNEMAPKGEKLAYINNREAELLKRMGGAGVDINKTGIKSYFDPGSGRGSVSESLSQAAFGSSGPTFSSDGGSGSFTPTGNFATITKNEGGLKTAPKMFNLQKHFDQNQLLKNAVRAGTMTEEEYNILGGYDVQRTMGLNNPVLGALGNLVGSLGYNTVQSIRDGQPVFEGLKDVGRNIMGGAGLFSPALKNQYENIIAQGKARGGRVNYANGGSSYDEAGIQTTSAQMDAATGGGSNGGGSSYDYIPQPTMAQLSTAPIREGGNVLTNAIKTAGDYAKKGINYISQRPMNVMSILSGFNPVTMGLMYLANKFGGPRSTGDNPNASPSMSTANEPYSVMRTGGTYDVPYTGENNMPPIIPQMPMIAELPTDVISAPSDFDLYMRNLRTAQPSPFMLDPRFSAADGGLASLRQQYKIGKLVKKITEPVKKIIKSDVGKAALTAAALYGGSKFLGSPTGTGFKKFLFGASPMLEEPYIGPLPGKEGFLNKLGLTKRAGSMALTGRGLAGLGILGASAAAGLSAAGQEDDEETLDGISSREDTSGLKELIAKYPALRFQVPKEFQLAAQGGRIGYEMGGDIDPADLPMSKEGFPRYEDELGEEVPYPYDNQEMASDPDPMAELFQMYQEAIRSGQIPRSTTFDEYKELRNEMSSRSMKPQMLAYGGRIGYEEGGLMNLGGMEKDYRAEGGFVPIGGKEKADDVPARLSKNEFVFTADAVRNAGEGDIDKGAEVMENVMKHLEAGGTVSEESQGLAGAKKMFQTSQRLGEVL